MRCDLDELRSALEPRLGKGLVSTAILLGRARLIDEASRQTSAFSDPKYLPFFYHLGVALKSAAPSSLVEFGFRLGLPSCCFLQGCPSVSDFLGFQELLGEVEYYSPRLAKGNVKDRFRGSFKSHFGRVTDPEFLDDLQGRQWDVALVSEETDYDRHMTYLDLLWPRMAAGGLLVVDFLERHAPSSRAFSDFCRAKNRRAVFFPTRYGVGVIQR